MARKAYLAGPDVFFPNAGAVGAAKKAICAEHGLVGVFPLDQDLALGHLDPHGQGMAIYRANLALMAGCDLVIANMTPFRGPGMDPGTAFEMGVFAARGLPVLGYSNSAGAYAQRVESWFGLMETADPFEIENFDMADNLMLEGAVVNSGHALLRPERDLPPDDLSLFRLCVQQAAAG